MTPSTTGPTASMMEETAAHPRSPPGRYTNTPLTSVVFIYEQKNWFPSLSYHLFCFFKKDFGALFQQTGYNFTISVCFALKGGKALFGWLQVSRLAIEMEPGGQELDSKPDSSCLL